MIEVKMGNAWELIKTQENNNIDCVVTSPPYWQLRDYGTDPIIFDGKPDCIHDWSEIVRRPNGGKGDNANVGANQNSDANMRDHDVISHTCDKCGAWKGSFGQEPTPEMYINHLLNLFDEVKQKLKDEGNCFINLGDTYGGGGGNGFKQGISNENLSTSGMEKEYSFRKRTGRIDDVPAKSLSMIPSRFAWGMIQQGWILRNEIIWSKNNHMPESVTDRLTRAHEVIYHFVKQQDYYYNLDAIREPHTTTNKKGISHKMSTLQKSSTSCFCGNEEHTRHINGKNPGDVWNINTKYKIGDGYRQGMNRDENKTSVQRRFQPDQNEIAEFLKPILLKIPDKLNEIFGEHKWRHWIRTDNGGASLPLPEDYQRLKRITVVPDTYDKLLLEIKEVSQAVQPNPLGKNPADVWEISTTPYHDSHFAVFPLELIRRPILAGCPVNGTVLDPFAGSGTVGEFCRHNDRNALLFELNREYKPLIEERAMLHTKGLEVYL